MVIDFNHIWRELGNRYRQLRVKGGLTQEDMAQFGFSIRHYQQLEAGRPHTMQTMLKIAFIFKVEPSQLVSHLIEIKEDKLAS